MPKAIMHRALLCGLLLAAVNPAFAQDKDSRKRLEAELKDAYQVTKTQAFQKNNITVAGTLFVLQKDEIGADLSSDAIWHTNRILDGNVKTGGGAGGLFAKTTTKFLSTGDRVYVTDLSVRDDGIAVAVLTKDSWATELHGTTKQMRYAGFLVFTVDKADMAAMDLAGAEKLIEAILLPAEKATAVNTKTIELGQTTDEVAAIFGKPESVAKLGAKTIYTYKTMKVIFTDGKVTDVQ